MPVLLLLGLMVQNLTGQDGTADSRRAKVIEAKKAYIKESVSFSAKEESSFWGIYDRYHKGRHDSVTRKRKRDESQVTEMSNAAANELLEKYIDEKRSDIDRYVAYLQEMKTLLGAKRVIQLQRAERSFNNDVLKSLNIKKRKKQEKTK